MRTVKAAVSVVISAALCLSLADSNLSISKQAPDYSRNFPFDVQMY